MNCSRALCDAAKKTQRLGITWLLLSVLAFRSTGVALAQSVEPEPTSFDERKLAALQTEDLKYVHECAYGLVVVRPAKIAALSEIQAVPGADLGGANPFKPSEVERFVWMIYPNRRTWKLETAMVIQLTKDVSSDQIVQQISPDATQDPNEERLYKPTDLDSDRPAIGFPDSRTILIGTDTFFVYDRLQSSRAKNASPSRFGKLFTNLDLESHAYAGIDFERLRHFLESARSEIRPDWVDRLGPLSFVRAMHVAINLSKPEGLVVVGESGEATETPELGKRILESSVAILKQEMETLRFSLDDQGLEKTRAIERQCESLLATMSIHDNSTSSMLRSRELGAVTMMKLVALVGSAYLDLVRSKQAQSLFAWNMHSIGLAFHEYHDQFNELPRDSVSPNGQALLSWRVALLPWLGQRALYNRFRLDEAWDSPHNIKLLTQMPSVFQVRGKGEPNKTSIQRVTGPGTGGDANSFADIRGLGSVLAIIESEASAEWTKPGGFEFDQQNPAAGLYECGSFAVMFDGSLIYIYPTIAPEVLRSPFLNDGSKFDDEAFAYPGTRNTERPIHPATITAERVEAILEAMAGGSNRDILEDLRTLATAVPTIDRSAVVLDRVTPFLRSTSPFVRQAALKAIDRWSVGAKADWRRLAELLQDPMEGNRWRAVELLADFREPELVQSLLRMPACDDAATRTVLYHRYATIAAEAVLPMLHDSDPKIRTYAAFLIGSTGGGEHMAAIQALLADNDEECRNAAQVVLRKWQQPSRLQQALDDSAADLTVALSKILEFVQPDQNGNLIEVDLSPRNAKGHLDVRDFRLLGSLSQLQSLTLSSTLATAEDVAYIADLPLRKLKINYCPRVNDDVSESLRRLKSLQELNIEETNVGDETAMAVGSLTDLRKLDLTGTRITDVGAEHLAKLTKLRQLHLSETRVTDSGAKFLVNLSELELLYLERTELTDSCIESLATLRSLKFLGLSNTHLTDAGFDRLKSALPNCRVIGKD